MKNGRKIINATEPILRLPYANMQKLCGHCNKVTDMCDK